MRVFLVQQLYEAAFYVEAASRREVERAFGPLWAVLEIEVQPAEQAAEAARRKYPELFEER